MVTNNAYSIGDKRRTLEIGAVLATALGKFIFMDWLEWRLPFILVVIAGWFAYILYRNKSEPLSFQCWGFRWDTAGKTWRMLFPFAAGSIILFVVIGLIQDSIQVTWHILPIMLLYPVWGIVQQFLVIALVAGNLQDMQNRRLKSSVIVMVTALLFGLIHYPYLWLMIGTFVLALLYGYVYLKVRNLYVLGLFHGWLGGLFFYTVVDRDPFLEVFGSLLRN